jgi:hypothetical protein
VTISNCFDLIAGQLLIKNSGLTKTAGNSRFGKKLADGISIGYSLQSASVRADGILSASEIIGTF